MSKKNEDQSNQPKLVKIQTSMNPIEVGTIPMSLLKQRRTNFRKMTKQQRAALKLSMDTAGMQSFIQVVRNDDGTFSIVDGHHRRDELLERGATDIPVVVLPENLDEKAADTLMLTFNVSADLDDTEFAKLLDDMLQKGIAKEQVATAAVISTDMLDQLQNALNEMEVPDAPLDELPNEVKGANATKAKKAPKIKIVHLWPSDPESNMANVLCATHADTVINREVVGALKEAGYDLEEIEPVWFDGPDDMLEKLSESN